MSVESDNRAHRPRLAHELGLLASRRQMLRGACVGALLIGAGGSAVLARASGPTRMDAVLSFHSDEPWLDRTGRAAPWHPPCGCRSGEGVEPLSDEMLRRVNCYV
ncbi:hypothetical protein M2336_000036 [Sphingobium sp. B1D7B]|uniref:hypothetical protein n=1 Tax=Sphingobium sp. B1D7B TaxID=2940578 RepID=UPI0022243D7F|nr:hypothetical protein [Sphingobium sp. B1D7B]MCW2403407.1 hypothetical protein [Sphingobium sp. B1D7B]